MQPVYRKTAPIAQRLYRDGYDFTVTTAIPQAQYAGNILGVFWQRQIWPTVRVLYGENVEPQLNRITERLGRYKDGKKLEAEIKSLESSSRAAEASADISSILSSFSSTVTEATASPSSARPRTRSGPTSVPSKAAPRTRSTSSRNSSTAGTP